MTIERTDKKEERFWAISLVSVGLLLGLCYLLTHSAAIFRLVMTRIAGPGEGISSVSGKAQHLLSYGSNFLWGSGLVLILSYIFRRSKEQLKSGLVIAIAFEAVLFFAVLALRSGIPAPGTCFAVASGNGLAFLSVLVHKRILI